MAEQFSLPGFDLPAPPQPRAQAPAQHAPRLPHSLFFAIFPGAEDAQRIARLAQALRTQHGLTGRPLLPARLHVTLHDLGGYADGVPAHVAEAAKAAAATVVVPRLDLAFDRVLSFPGSGALVMRSATASAAVSALVQALGLAVQRAGLRSRPVGTPHMTLMYDQRHVAEHGIEPVLWSAAEFVLVHSLVGRTEHVPLGRWSLRG